MKTNTYYNALCVSFFPRVTRFKVAFNISATSWHRSSDTADKSTG